MSLDVYLQKTRWISYDEGQTYTEDDEEVYNANITHNLGQMATEAGIYDALWRPYRLHPEYSDMEDDYDKEMAFEESVTMHAKDIIPYLEDGLKKLKDDPEHYKKFNSSNGWGMYDNFVPFVENYLEACKENPDCMVTTWR